MPMPGGKNTSQGAKAAAAFPIVAIGASAGGLDPIRELLRNVGDAPAAAFIVVLHQAAHDGSLVDVLARAAALPVVAAQSGAVITPDRVFVVPAGSEAELDGDRFVLRPFSPGERHAPVDTLFTSLAEQCGSRVMAVVLSGSGADGAAGSEAVKNAGGLTFVQDEKADFPQMPRASAAAGAADFVLGPVEIAQEIVRRTKSGSSKASPGFARSDLQAIFDLLHVAHDVDFTHYKPATIERRCRRRMAQHQITSFGDYIALLKQDAQELERLYADMLIQVTGFFRDPGVFMTLQREVVPELVTRHPEHAPVRIWVPGCATGEEVYSLAMLFLETTPEDEPPLAVQLFGTDISDAAISHARAGLYADSIAEAVPPERLARFFTRTDEGYRVSKTLRECCVFARHDVTRDPPFSRLDLISCRNVLIYFGTPLQKKVTSIFHYALRSDAFLLLGASEAIGSQSDLFRVADRRAKLYRKKAAPQRIAVPPRTVSASARSTGKIRMEDEGTSTTTVFREADRVMLARLAPPGVLIDENMDVLQFRGRTSPFLEPPTGMATFNLLRMAREGLVADLSAAIQAARKQTAPVRREGVRIQADGEQILVNVEVVPFLASNGERYLLVLFEHAAAAGEEGPGRRRKSKAAPEKETSSTLRLKRELEATREYLQAIIEEQEAMNEELRSANEEIQSSNEELQSTNEELETAKEELQSSNEELTTLNEELENRNHETARVSDDLQNVLAAMEMPVVIVDAHFRIRRFNAEAQRALNLIAADVGRPISALEATLAVQDLEGILRTATEQNEPREVSVEDRRGRSYTLRIHRYMTVDNHLDGAVLVLI